MKRFSRRQFLQLGAATGAMLVLEALPGGRLVLADPDAPARGGKELAPNAWLILHGDGRIIVWVARAEMGQGVRTSLPLIVAEELDVDPADVTVHHTQPAAEYNMRTSGSGSVLGAWMPLRRAGATARALLVAAGAQRWKVAPEDCTTERAHVIHAATGRRATYAELIEEARVLPVPSQPPLRDQARWRLLGKRTPRRDGPDIVRGAARYGIDMRVTGMQVATVARAPHLGATVERFDASAALKVPGVSRVVPIGSGVAVVGRDTWSALKGREALRVDWKPGAGASFDSRAHDARLLEATRGPGRPAQADPGTEATLAGAARRIERTFEYAFQAHAPMEPMNCVASVRDGACDLWVGTQAANQGQAVVAERLGIAPEKVRVHLALLGGGFGRRLGTDYMVEAAELSKALGTPVQVVWTREDDMRNGFFHPASAHRVTAGLDGSGRLIAWKHVLATSFLSYRGLPADPNDPELPGDYHWGAIDHPYVLPSLTAAVVFVDSPVPSGPWRAVHYPGGVLARESMLDEVARAAGKDAVALRLELLRGAAGESREKALGREALVGAIRLAAEKSNWGSALPAGRGRGIAANLYHGMTAMAQVAEVSVERDRIRVHRIVCAVDCGTPVNPLGVEGQVESAIVWGLTAGLASEITFTHGRADQGTFASYPVLRIADAPEIEVHLVPSESPPLGIGEQSVAPIAAAVANAVFAASGRTLGRCPMRV